jgi:ATP-dependent DNA helicase RecQ
LSVIKQKTLTIEQLEEIIAPTDSEVFIDVVRDLVDEGQLEYDDVWRLKLVKQNGGRRVK